jgi:hypothetical protein
LATPAAAFDETFERKYPLRAGGAFSLSNVNGSVQVDGWEHEEVWIRAVKSSRRSAQDLPLVKIEVQADAEAVSVRTRYPEGEGLDVSVDFRVRVPYRVLLGHVESVNGTVRVRGVEGAGELRAVNGNLELLDSAGRFSARTTNGSVRLELRQLLGGGPMRVETVNGSVVLALPRDADAELEALSVNGDFRSELPVTLTTVNNLREFRGRLGRGGSLVQVRTVNGGIRVVAARPAV